MPKPMIICPYCGVPAKFVDSIVVFKVRSYGMIWLCSNYPACDARVGCHDETDSPLGTMANRALREKRKAVHAVFDPLWKGGGKSRGEAYDLLADLMGKPVNLTHIGMFSESECDEALEALEQWNKFSKDIEP